MPRSMAMSATLNTQGKDSPEKSKKSATAPSSTRSIRLFPTAPPRIRPSPTARSLARKPDAVSVDGTMPSLVDGLVALVCATVRKPWSAVTKTSVVWSSPWSFSAASNSPSVVSALRVPALPDGPLMPGLYSPTLSLVLCWLMSGSRDQNSSANGLPASLKCGSTMRVAAFTCHTSCSMLGTALLGAAGATNAAFISRVRWGFNYSRPIGPAPAPPRSAWSR